MTQATLPVLGGGNIKAEDVQDGWFVKLRGGAVLPVTPDDNDGAGPIYSHVAYDGTGHFLWWKPDGRVGNDAFGIKDDLDIVLILGPSEETHGDGTVTKLWTGPMRLTAKAWDRFDVVSVAKTYTPMGDRENTACLFARPKPVPSPTYTERLIEAVNKGEVVLPPDAITLHHDQNYDPWNGKWVIQFGFTSWEHWQNKLNGPLPPWQPGMEESIDLATVREAADKK